MLKLLLIAGCFFLISAINVESIYGYSVTSIEGNNTPLSAYTGKKILIVTLPTVQNSSNDSLLYSLDSLKTVYNSSLVIIATPSYEDGYTIARKDELKMWYRSILNANIIVTDGLYTRKTSGSLQHPLFKWLTDENQNGHFAQDITGPKNKFFIWIDGELSGVIGERTRLSSFVINDLLQGQ